jgi:hypothetical protein
VKEKVQNHLNLAQVILRGLDQANRIFLFDLSFGHSTTAELLESIGLNINRFMLRPEIFAFVTATHTERNVMIDFKMLATHAIDLIAEHGVVLLNDFALRSRFDVAIAVTDMFWIAVGIAIFANRTRREFGVGLDGIIGLFRRESVSKTERRNEGQEENQDEESLLHSASGSQAFQGPGRDAGPIASIYSKSEGDYFGKRELEQEKVDDAMQGERGIRFAVCCFLGSVFGSVSDQEQIRKQPPVF